MAENALCDEETVKRRLRSMRRRGVIARGNQGIVAYIRADRRPTVYDLLIPRSWFSNDQWDDVQQRREARGLPRVDPGDRPDLPPPPHRGRSTRSDKGQPNPRRASTKKGSTREEDDTGALQEPPVDNSHGGSNSRRTGALTVVDGGSKRAPTLVVDPPTSNPPPRGNEEEEREHGRNETSEAVMLREHAQFRPGKFLGDEARAECERLLAEHRQAGWPDERLARWLRDWSAQAHNPSRYLVDQLRNLGTPPKAAVPARPRQLDDRAGGQVPASDEARKRARAQVSLKQAPAGSKRRAWDQQQIETSQQDRPAQGLASLDELLGQFSSTDSADRERH